MPLLLAPLHGALLLIGLAVLAVKAFALIDCCLRPEGSFVAADKQTKTFWVVVLVVAAITAWFGFFGLIGLVAAIVYLVDVRPQLRAFGGQR